MALLSTARLRFTWTRVLPEALAGAAFAAAGVVVLVLKSPELHRGFLGLVYLALLGLIAVQDMRTRRAPNRIVYPSVGFAVVASMTLGSGDAIEALLGGLVAFAALLIVALAGRGAMGFGDVKVGTLCGIVVGLHGVLPVLALSFVAGAAVAALLLVSRLRKRRDTIAFTPFLLAATMFSLSYYELYLLG